jgi:hypothetical protein
VAFSPARQADDLTMQIEAGIGQWYRAGHWIPIQVTVQSPNTTLDGRLQVRVGRVTTSATQFETTYQTPFSISAGGSKRVFIYVSLDDYTEDLQVELVNNEGRVVISQRSDLRQLSYDDILQVVVTDSAAGVLDVTRYPVGRGENWQVPWRIEDIPANSEALRSIDVMVFSDVDSGELTPTQFEAIQAWLASGGHLIVTGGANWQRTASGLLPLLPTDPQSTLTLDGINALGEFIRFPNEDVLNQATLVAQNTPKPTSRVLVSAQETPLIVRGDVGAGTSDFVAVDATTEPLRSWAELDYLWQALLFSAESRPSWGHGIERSELARDAVSNVEGFDLPSVLQLGAFLGLYILLMGPINYAFVSLIKRRELAWFTIPVLIVVFTAFAYFTGFSLRGDDVTVNQVSVIQVWEGVERAQVDAAIGILSPRRTTYDVVMGEGLTLRTLPNISAPDGLTELTIAEGGQYIAQDIPVDAAIMTNFASSGTIPAPDFNGQATWTLRGAGVESRLVGRVSNPLDHTLERAVIMADTQSYLVGDIEPGETKEFSFSLPLALSSRLTLGNRVDPARPVLYQYYNYNPNYNLCFLTNGINQVYQEVMQDQSFDCNGGGSERDLRLRRRALLLNATNNEIDLSGGRGSNVYLLGWSEEAPLSIQIPDSGQINNGAALYIYKIPTNYEVSNPNRITLPPGMFSWTLIEQDLPNRLPEIRPDLSFELTGQQGVAIRFTPLADAPTLQAQQIQLDFGWRLDVANYLNLYLWDWAANAWEEVEFTQENQTQFIIEDSAYLGPQNALQVLIESDNANAFQTVESVQVSLRGTE